MSLKNWYPFYVGDYARDTSRLTVLEHGAYILLLNEYYASGEALPSDKIHLYRICRAFEDSEKNAINNILDLYFILDEKKEVYINKKAEDELKKRGDISKKRKQAIEKRWKKEKNKSNTNVYSKRIPSTSTSTSTSTNTSKDDLCTSFLDDAINKYNQTGLPKVQKLSQARKSKLKARLKDCGGIEGWDACLEKVRSSDFLMGRAKDWKADFDFIITESKFIKIMEGAYDNTKQINNLKIQAKDMIQNGW